MCEVSSGRKALWACGLAMASAAWGGGRTLGAGLLGAEEVPAAPKNAEKKLAAEDAEKVLAALTERFARQAYLRAKVKMEFEDLMGPQTREGVLLIKRPFKALRRFDGAPNTHPVWYFDGKQSMEFNCAKKKVVVWDFSGAPKKLALLRAALTADLPQLKEYFDLQIFKTAGQGGAPDTFRFLLTPKAEAGNPMNLSYIQMLMAEGAPFFHQLDKVYKPGFGEPVQEKYSEIKEETEIPEKEFTDPLLERGPREVEKVTDTPVKK